MKLIILRGIPGSGKSTFQRSEFPGAVVTSADLFFMVDGEYRFDPTRLGEAHGFCCRCTVAALQGGEPLVVVDNTNISVAEIAPYVLLGQAYGYEVEIVSIHCDPETAAARNTHGVPFGVVVDRLAPALLRAEGDFPPWWQHRVVEV